MEKQLFEFIDINSLYSYLTKDFILKEQYSTSDSQIEKINLVDIVNFCSNKKLFSEKKLLKANKIISDLLNGVIDVDAKHHKKTIVLKQIITITANSILQKSLLKTLIELNFLSKKTAVDYKDYNIVIFNNLLEILELYGHIIDTSKSIRLNKNEPSTYTMYINSIIKLIQEWLDKIEQQTVSLGTQQQYFSDIEQVQRDVYSKVEKIFKETKVSNLILDYWEIISEFLLDTFSFKLALITKDLGLKGVVELATVSEYMLANYLIKGYNILEKKGILVDLIDTTTHLIFGLLLSFGGNKILGLGSFGNLNMGMLHGEKNHVVSNFFIFIYPYLSRFIKYNVLKFLKLTPLQVNIVSTINNYNNVLSSKDAGVIKIKDSVNITLKHLTKIRTSSKLSSLIHNTFLFFKKEYKEGKDFKKTIPFSAIIKEEFGIESLYNLEEIQVNITGMTDNNTSLAMLLVEDNNVLQVFNLIKNVVKAYKRVLYLQQTTQTNEIYSKEKIKILLTKLGSDIILLKQLTAMEFIPEKAIDCMEGDLNMDYIHSYLYNFLESYIKENDIDIVYSFEELENVIYAFIIRLTKE